MDRAADYQPLDGVRSHVADGFTDREEGFGAVSFHLQQWAVAGNADFADAAILIDGAASLILKIVPVLHGDFLATDLCALLRVHSDAGCNSAAPAVGRQETQIGLVMAALDFERGDRKSTRLNSSH